ncbi:MAG: MTH1187 family thiamine-binding protein [Thermodesulfobacteriota bacterium]
MSAIIEFSIFPMDKGTSLSPYVARAVKIVRESGLPYRFGPMSTSIEGEWEEAMAVINDCFAELKKDCGRINLSLRVDYRQGPGGRLKSKIKSVEDKL